MLFFPEKKDETQCKDNSQDTDNIAFILHSHGVHIHVSYMAFAFALSLRSAFTHHSQALTFVQRAPSVPTECAQRSFIVHSIFKWESRTVSVCIFSMTGLLKL